MGIFDSTCGAYAIDGEINGKRVPKGVYFILWEDEFTEGEVLSSGDEYDDIKLKDNIASLDVVSQTHASTTGGGVQGAAAGAVLGFLIAGPVGTVLGAGAGSKKKVQGTDQTIIAIKFVSGEQLILKSIDPPLLEKLQSYHHMSSAYITEKKEKTSQLGIEKPKQPPKYDFELEAIKGRKISDKSKLPDLPYLLKWESVEGNEQAIRMLNKNLREEVQNYNNFKWTYFDQVIESENEIDLLATQVLKNFIVLSNQAKNSKDNIVHLETDIKSLENDLKESNAALKTAEEDLLEAGFLKKGGIKKQINSIETDIDHTKSLISKNKRSITNSNKKFDSLKEMISIDDPASEFVSIFGKVLPDSQKLKKNLKSKKGINTQFFLDTYKKVFDEVWDKKIKEKNSVPQNTIKEEHKTTSQAHPKRTVKERLAELKSLLEDGLINEEEFSAKREELLEQL